MAAALHLDWIDYAERLLGGGAVDWTAPDDVAQLILKAQALMPSDLVALPLDRMLFAAGQPGSSARGFHGAAPLRDLLADPVSRERALASVRMLAALPMLALGLPAPIEAAALASRLAGVEPDEPDEDLVDDAAVYIADFLRLFAGEAVAAVVLTEQRPRGHWREFYAPIAKVATGYGWRFAVQGHDSPLWEGIRSEHIPVDGEPEAVLARIRQLRLEGTGG